MKPALQEMIEFSKQKRKGHDQKYEKYRRKNHIGKVKYTVKVVAQPLIKLLGRLKDKSSKIIYIHSKY